MGILKQLTVTGKAEHEQGKSKNPRVRQEENLMIWCFANQGLLDAKVNFEHLLLSLFLLQNARHSCVKGWIVHTKGGSVHEYRVILSWRIISCGPCTRRCGDIRSRILFKFLRRRKSFPRSNAGRVGRPFSAHINFQRNNRASGAFSMDDRFVINRGVAAGLWRKVRRRMDCTSGRRNGERLQHNKAVGAPAALFVFRKSVLGENVGTVLKWATQL